MLGTKLMRALQLAHRGKFPSVLHTNRYQKKSNIHTQKESVIDLEGKVEML